jgi:hypothetical protein
VNFHRGRESETMTDRYMKIILTIIAACLVWDIATGSIPRALADGPVHVILDGWATTDGGYANRFDGNPLPVKVRQ